jgi:hypothetical protein
VKKKKVCGTVETKQIADTSAEKMSEDEKQKPDQCPKPKTPRCTYFLL